MEPQAHHGALCGVPSLREPRLPAQCLGSGHMSQGSSKMGKSRRLYNSSAWRSRGSWKFLAILTVSMPQTLTSPDCRLWSQEAPLERVGTKAGVLEAPLATQGLKQGLRPFLPAGNGASGICSLFQRSLRPPTSPAVAIRGLPLCTPIHPLPGSPSPGKLGGSSPMPPLSSARLNLVTNYPWALLFLFCFINL